MGVNVLLLAGLSLLAAIDRPAAPAATQPPVAVQPAPADVDLSPKLDALALSTPAGPLAPRHGAAWLPRGGAADRSQTIDLEAVAMSVLDGHAPEVARWVRGPFLVLPAVYRTPCGSSALGLGTIIRTP